MTIHTATRHFAIMRSFDPEFGLLVHHAQETVRKALKRSKRPYVAFSGGKDSLATLALVHSVDPNIALHWSDDELEYPETVDLMTALKALAGEQMIITHGWAQHAGWFRPWRDSPLWREPVPGTLHAGMDSDEWMARQHYDLVFTGLRKAESQVRRDWLESAGPIYNVKIGTGRRCCPIMDWSVEDVWALIVSTGIAYNKAYDVMDGIGVALEGQRIGPLPLSPEIVLAEGWPDLYDRLIERYGRRWR